MTSIEEFRDYLRTEAERTFHEIETALQHKLSFYRPQLWDGIKLDVSHNLNNIYFEMLDFLTWLEQENKTVRSKKAKALISNLRKDVDEVSEFQKYVSTLDPASLFKTKEIFTGYQQNLVRRGHNLASKVLQYLEGLAVLENELMNTEVILKGVGDFIVSVPGSISKIKEKIKALEVESFTGQKEKLALELQAYSVQVVDNYTALKKIKKISALTRVLAALQIAKENLRLLIQNIRKTDPQAWKQNKAAFEVYKKHLLQDLEGLVKVFAIAAKDLQDAKKQLAA